MAKINKLTEVDEWVKLWDGLKSPDAAADFIFKLSPICPTSHHAEEIVGRYLATLPESPKLQIYSVDVIAARPVSQRIAADTQVTHQSPQAILINAARVIAFDASHGDIDDDLLEKLPR